MCKAKLLLIKILRIRLGKLEKKKRFQKGLKDLYGADPHKRMQKIDRLISDERSVLLK